LGEVAAADANGVSGEEEENEDEDCDDLAIAVPKTSFPMAAQSALGAQQLRQQRRLHPYQQGLQQADPEWGDTGLAGSEGDQELARSIQSMARLSGNLSAGFHQSSLRRMA